jgi:hypothetical protein
MVRHDDEGVQEEFSLAAVVEDGSLQQFRCGRDLKKAAAFGRHSGNHVGSSFLRREVHLSNIDERPAAKATFLCSQLSGA